MLLALMLSLSCASTNPIPSSVSPRPISPISLDVFPAFGMAPLAAFRVRVRVARDPLNVMWNLTVDGPNYYRSSDTPLDGLVSPITQPLIFEERMPEGEYLVTASVWRKLVTGLTLAGQATMTFKSIGDQSPGATVP